MRFDAPPWTNSSEDQAMPRSQINRNDHFPIRIALVVVAVTLLAVGCSDSSTGPRAARSLGSSQPVLSKNDGQGEFIYDPSADITVKLGGNDHKIVIPAGAVCAVGKTKYGVGTWDLPCRLEDKKQNIKYKTWTDANGHPFIEFQPALRFAPGKEVLLYLADKKASMNDYSEILYCPDNKALSCYDESLTDPSVKSVRDRKGNIYRRIKHFSGYNVAAGIDEVSDDARWSVSATNSHAVASRAKKSGYMVVSGAEDEQDDDQDDNNQGNRRPDVDRN
jgi:hypothetical protein